MAQRTDKINSIAVTYTDSSKPGQNFYGAHTAFATSNYISLANSSVIRESLIKYQNFDNAVLSGRALVGITAYVYLVSAEISNVQNPWLSVYAINQDWDPSAVAYPYIPSEDINAGNTANITPNINSWKAIPLTNEILMAWLISARRYGAAIGSRGIASAYPTKCSFELSANGENAPYLSCVTDDAIPVFDSVIPYGGTVPSKAQAIFSFTLNSRDASGRLIIGNGIILSSTRLLWRTKGSTSPFNSVTGGTPDVFSITVPENTFPGKSNIEYKISVTTADGVTAESALYTAETTDAISSCAVIRPKDIIIIGDAATTLEWQHIIGSGTTQNAFDADYSTDGRNWASIFNHIMQPEQKAIIPANTFPAGMIYLRVRTYNSDDVAGNWSDPVANVVRAAPEPPVIGAVTKTPRPEVHWQASDQVAYEVEIGSKKSGKKYGTEKAYKSTEYISDGEIIVSVRIQNSYGLWSSWSTVSIIVENEPIGTVTLTAEPLHAGVRLNWDGTGEQYYVYRDGTMIAKTTAKTYFDQMAYKRHIYFVRAVDTDNYSISTEEIVIIRCNRWMIAEIGVFDWIYLNGRRGERPAIETEASTQIAYTHYAGRKFPVAEITGQLDETNTFEFSLFQHEDREHAEDMLGKLVILKTPYGKRHIGILSGLSAITDRIAKDFVFTIIAVDYTEEITDDV